MKALDPRQRTPICARHYAWPWWISIRLGDVLRSFIKDMPRSRSIQNEVCSLFMSLVLVKANQQLSDFCPLLFTVLTISCDLYRGHLYVALKIVRRATEERIIWIVTFYNIKGKLLNVLLRIAKVASHCKAIWKDMLKRCMMRILPLLVVVKIRSSLYVLKLAVVRFSDMHHNYRSMKILMASFLSFDFAIWIC